MSVYEIYHNLRYLAWHNRTVKKYHEAMERKQDLKK